MRLKGFEFSLREFGGSLGDFGTLLPFTVGYIVICGMPLLWSHLDHGQPCNPTVSNHAWGPVQDWMLDKSRLILAGYGSYFFTNQIHNKKQLIAGWEQIKNQSLFH